MHSRIKVTIPQKDLKRSYIINVLLGDFLGLNYTIVCDDKVKGYKLEFNNKYILVQDCFFSKFKKDFDYLSIENIPKTIVFQKKKSNQFLKERDIPIIYGTNELKIKELSIETGIDIFASSFFMLTRWEEFVNKQRDEHKRFAAKESVAFKNNFLHRPVVNEYVEMLWNMMSFLGIKQQRKIREFSFVLTHDVDFTRKYNSITTGIIEIVGDIIRRKNVKLAIQNLVCKLRSHIKGEDPYDTFDYLMNISDKLGVKSHFFFMARGETSFDNNYKTTEKFVKKLVNRIVKRGHLLGLHPSYNAFNNYKLFQREKIELETNFNSEIRFGRNHYLRFEVPTSWQVWNDNGMSWDSTVCYADKEGFRCGTCYDFPVFNVLTGKKLILREKPLIVMEGSFMTYQNEISADEMIHRVGELISTVKKYNGEFVFLWHNSSFYDAKYLRYKEVYERVLL